MTELLNYRQCEYEIGGHLIDHGKLEGKWSPTFKILSTPVGKHSFVSGEDSNGPHTETREEAEVLADEQVRAWVDKHWTGFPTE